MINCEVIFLDGRKDSSHSAFLSFQSTETCQEAVPQGDALIQTRLAVTFNVLDSIPEGVTLLMANMSILMLN